MSELGVRLTLLLGPTVARPAPLAFIENLAAVEVRHSDEERSGFQLVFKVGRRGPLDLLEYPQLRSPLLAAFNRVILIVTFNVRPRVLMDGIITHVELQPGDEAGAATLTVTGEDVSVMMDLEERAVEHPALPDPAIVFKLLARYARFGILPAVVPPKVIDPPIPIERIPVQVGTDREYLETLARRHGHVFYLTAGPAPFTNTAYWGPPRRLGVPQRALSVNFGSQTNVTSLAFQHDALKPAFVDGDAIDARFNRKFPVRTFAAQRVPPLSLRPTWLAQRANTRTTLYRGCAPSIPAAFGRAQAYTDASTDATVTASGELDAARYGEILRARELVGLRGAGLSHDGLYYVKAVTHRLGRGTYTQSFTLTRDGLGTTVPVVRP